MTTTFFQDRQIFTLRRCFVLHGVFRVSLADTALGSMLLYQDVLFGFNAWLGIFDADPVCCLVFGLPVVHDRLVSFDIVPEWQFLSKRH